MNFVQQYGYGYADQLIVVNLTRTYHMKRKRSFHVIPNEVKKYKTSRCLNSESKLVIMKILVEYSNFLLYAEVIKNVHYR